MKRLQLILILCIAGGLCSAEAIRAQQPKRGDKNAAAKANANSGMNKAREAAALAFVREHHAELEALLIQLKESEPKQYEQAVRDLFRNSERLALLQEKDAQRHELELRAWQARSRVQLLSAMLLMSPQDKPTAGKLKEALTAENEVRREILMHERERMSKRLERIDAQIESLDKNSQKSVDRQIQQLIEGNRPSGKASTPDID